MSRATAPSCGTDPVELVRRLMPPGRLPKEVLLARPTGKRPRGGPRTKWRDYISSVAWESLGIPQSELADMAGEREVWGSLLKMLPP